MDIPRNRIGCVIEGKHHGRYVYIIDDPDETGGIYIFVGTKPDGSDAVDYWVENTDSLDQFFVDTGWVINWTSDLIFPHMSAEDTHALEHMVLSTPIDKDTMARIRDSISMRDKIRAIKLYHDAIKDFFGGEAKNLLWVAKESVDQLEKQMLE